MAIAWAIMALKSSAVIWDSTASIASFRAALPFMTETPMFTFSARSCSVNWKSPYVPEKSRITMSG